MKIKRNLFHLKIFLVAIHYLLIVLPLAASAAQVTLQWDANDPVPASYRLYQREAGQSYDYSSYAWSGEETTATLSDLTEGTTYYYVVRAFDGTNESGDSNEVEYTPSVISVDSDGDGVNDSSDAFPQDASEWLDTDSDGLGNNADTDDDGDGMADLWEAAYGLDPLVDDAGQDMDNDGISNLDEYQAGSDPSQAPGNSVPDKPHNSAPYHQAIVEMNPTLSTGAFSDPDNDAHAGTHFQISTEESFTSLVFEKVSSIHLTSISIGDLILDPDATYYWRVRFYDEHNGESEWSDYTSFTTIDHEAAGDLNANGILESQEVSTYIDLDEDGNDDTLQDGMMSVSSNDPVNPYISIQRVDDDVQLFGIQAMSPNGAMSLAGNQPENLTSVISFKLHLPEGVTETSITVFFSQAAPSNARWYKYDPDLGWTAYPEAVFSVDHRSVTLTLEDGGMGDMDGVENGVIVDPAGLGYSSSQSTDTSTTYSPSEAGSSGCFISTAKTSELKGSDRVLVMIGLLIVGCLGAALCKGFSRCNVKEGTRYVF